MQTKSTGVRRSSRKKIPTAEIADRLHSAAIHLLRTVRQADSATGLSPARLSALSVLVFGGPQSLGKLAQAEQVRPPTMSRLVDGLELDGLARREADSEDARAVRISATAKGRKVLGRAREARIQALVRLLETLPKKERDLLGEAANVIEDVLRQGRR